MTAPKSPEEAAWWAKVSVPIDERAPSIDRLTAEFKAYTEPRGLYGQGDAMELLMGDLAEDDRQWLSAFVTRWDAAERADPAFHDRQRVA